MVTGLHVAIYEVRLYRSRHHQFALVLIDNIIIKLKLQINLYIPPRLALLSHSTTFTDTLSNFIEH